VNDLLLRANPRKTGYTRRLADLFRDGLQEARAEVRDVDVTEIRFPVAENPRLARETPEPLSRIELSPFGIHWPDLDEDLSFQGLLRGDCGQHHKVEPEGGGNRH